LLEPAPASSQFRTVMAFLDAYARPITDDDPQAARLRRARAAVRETLDALAVAHAAHDETPMRIADVSAAARRWIGEQTFLPETRDTGVQLIDDQAARFGDFDDMAVVGLVEGEWPDRARRNIFYPPSLLASLGWPSEKDRRGAAEARFLDLLGAASRRVTASTITLDEDALVEVSAFADEIPRARLSTRPLDPPPSSPLSAEDAPAIHPSRLDGLDPVARSWAELRAARSSRVNAEYHGQTGVPATRTWSVSALETYLGCPFKFFARHILRLDEEPEDEEVMTPLTQGLFMHDVFEAFFTRWQADGHQAITPENIDLARAVFRDVAEERLATLSGTDAALEHTRLLGSPVAAGLGEAVLRLEAERPVPVVARLLERRLDGEFTFATPDGLRRVALRGKADRIDLLADGTFRLFDYKLGWPPGRDALQLPVYGMCAEQQLDGYLGRRWVLGEAAYLAFKGPRRVASLFTLREDRRETLGKAAVRLLETIDAIGRGEFPPTPDDVFRCETCSFAAVCRKDYVGDV
jgi:RecB family exonuclease